MTKVKDINLQREIGWLLKEKYNGRLTSKAKKDIARLKKGEPIDYVIGFTNFGIPSGSCKIDLSKKPLIPRSETEFWVNFIVRQNNFNNSKILDIFAGSGCIGLLVLKNTENSNVVFADIDKNAILQIKKNCVINKINKKKYKVVQSDVFKNLQSKKFKNYFDFILANPPYIPTKNKNKVQKSVLNFEPQNALFGGEDGLYFVKKFLKQAKNYLSENGIIFMEFDSSITQKHKIEKMLKDFNYESWQFHKDQFGKYRWVEIHFTQNLNRSKMN